MSKQLYIAINNYLQTVVNNNSDKLDLTPLTNRLKNDLISLSPNGLVKKYKVFYYTNLKSNAYKIIQYNEFNLKTKMRLYYDSVTKKVISVTDYLASSISNGGNKDVKNLILCQQILDNDDRYQLISIACPILLFANNNSKIIDDMDYLLLDSKKKKSYYPMLGLYEQALLDIADNDNFLVGEINELDIINALKDYFKRQFDYINNCIQEVQNIA